MFDVNKARLELEELEDEIITAEKKQKRLEGKLENLSSRRHYAKLVEAGRVVEEAGILESYDKNRLYLLLVTNKRDVVHSD